MPNPEYLGIAENFLPHLLSFYDLDPFSPTRGLGDRYFWGWKLKDFNNGLLQGGTHALALFLKIGSIPAEEQKRTLEIIDWIIEGTAKSQHSNGSLDEAFPNEYSYSVTAAVAFDFLSSIELLQNDITPEQKKRYLQVVASMINFICRSRESHGFITNHLAAAAAAILKYQVLSKVKIPQGNKILEEIIRRQSREGWYVEYEGPDPGYQTLATYYLAECFHANPDPNLLNSIRKSIEYLSFFLHPDGTMGGEYGSRNTEIFYPAGFELLRQDIPLAGVIADQISRAIASGKTVTLASVDPGNFIPLITSYLVAHRFSLNPDIHNEKLPSLPFEKENLSQFFPEANIYIRGNRKFYAVLGVSKGGVLKIFDQEKQQIIWDDSGYLGELTNGKRISTQCYQTPKNISLDVDKVRLTSQFFQILSDFPDPLRFTLLRILNITLMRNKWLGDLIKKFLVLHLITKKRHFPVFLNRTVNFSSNKINIHDHIESSCSLPFRWLIFGRKFTTIHMATSKYFQNQKRQGIRNIPEVNMDQLNRTGQTEIDFEITL